MSELGLVLYTDGGTRGSNPGYIGAGVHGYVYSMQAPPKNNGNRIPDWKATQLGYLEKKEKIKTIESEMTLEEIIGTVERKEPYEVDIVEYIDISRSENDPLYSWNTNNAAELLALSTALDVIQRYQTKVNCIISDSQYAIVGFTKHLDHWSKNGWRNKSNEPIKNKDFWEMIHLKKEIIHQLAYYYRIDWVKGHNGNIGNEKADMLATMAAERTYREKHGSSDTVHQYPINDVKHYHQNNVEIHNFLDGNRILFNPSLIEDQSKITQYYMVKFGDKQSDFTIGKNLPDCTYIMAELNDEDSTVGPVMRYQKKIMLDHKSNTNQIVGLSVPDLLSKKTSSEYSIYHDELFKVSDQGIPELTTHDNKPISHVYYPRYMTDLAVRDLNKLEVLMRNFSNNLSIEGHTTIYQDVLDVFYDLGKKDQYVLKPIYANTYNKLDINVPLDDGLLKVGLSIGIDTPKRNTLKRLESVIDKVKLILISEDGFLFNYYFYIETKEQEKCIWQSSHSNVVFKLKRS